MILGIFLALVLIPLFTWILRDHPRELGRLADGMATSPDRASSSQTSEMQVVDPAWAAVDWTFSKAVKTRRFWLLAFVATAIGIVPGVVAYTGIGAGLGATFAAGENPDIASVAGNLVPAFAALGVVSLMPVVWKKFFGRKAPKTETF